MWGLEPFTVLFHLRRSKNSWISTAISFHDDFWFSLFLSANRSFVRKWIRSLDECSKPDLVLYRADICLLFLIRLGLWMSCSVIDYYNSLSAFLFENALCALIFYIPFNHPLTLIYFQKRSLIMKHWTVDSVFWMDLCFRIAFFCFAFLCRNPHRPESWLVCLSPDNICF